jgi:hypothetical protein
MDLYILRKGVFTPVGGRRIGHLQWSRRMVVNFAPSVKADFWLPAFVREAFQLAPAYVRLFSLTDLFYSQPLTRRVRLKA